MQLTVLVDNNTLIDRYFWGEPGVSYWIEEGPTRVLFDVGYSDAFIRNAQKMQLDLLQADFVALSHGHLDHTWGLIPLIQQHTEAKIESISCKTPTLVAHPNIFDSKAAGPVTEIGSLLTKAKLQRHFPMHLQREPVWLTDRLVFLGEIERIHSFENREPVGCIGEWPSTEPDYVMEDSALAYIGREGLVIVTGCSHAGICNIIEYARKVCKQEKVIDVIGGFHLLQTPPRQMDPTLRYFEKLQATELHACHCVDLQAKIALAQVANLKEVGVGLQLNYE